MAETDRIAAASTALLVLDHQRMLVRGYAADPDAHLKAVASAVKQARDKGVTIIYVRKTFRPGYPEVHDNNGMFSAVRGAGRLLATDENTAIADEIAPAASDIVIDAHRVSAFEGSELTLILRARKIDTLALAGITTSGVVLSTVRQGADLDYRLYVLSDLCADNDKEVHAFLLEKILPRQAKVVTAAEFLSAL